MNFLIDMLNQNLLAGVPFTDQKLRDIIFFLIDLWDLGDYVDKVSIEKISNSDLGCYIFKTKKLIFSNHLICMSAKEEWDFSIEANEKCLGLNEMYIFKQLTTVFHELRHVEQFKVSSSSSKVIGDYVFKAIFLDCLKLSLEKYSKNYNIVPIEKDAEVFGAFWAFHCFTNSRNFRSDDMKFLKFTYYYVLTKGYWGLRNGSIERFYKYVIKDQIQYSKYLALSNKFSLLEKISYNFSLDGGEIKTLNKCFYHADCDINKTLTKKPIH